MRLIDQAVAARHLGRLVRAPVETGIGHNAARHGKGAVAAVEGQIGGGVADAVAHQRVGPLDLADDLAGIGVKKQLVGVEAVAVGRVIRPVGAQTVAGAGHQTFDMAMPDVAVAFRQGEAGQFLAAVVGEKADLDLRRIGREDGEIHPRTVEGRAQGPGAPGAHTAMREAVGRRHRAGCVHGRRLR